MADPRDVVSVERTIPAPPEKIFELLANPHRHRDIDGSGTVRDANPADPDRLSLGAKFGMKMKLGIPYSMTNTVVEFEDDRRIAWQPRPSAPIANRFGGRIWRYELEPQPDGSTLVRETWDISQEATKFLVRNEPTRKKTREAMSKTLERIEALVTA
jgi:uncharacterized protein YndB with AHSA1/START domain